MCQERLAIAAAIPSGGRQPDDCLRRDRDGYETVYASDPQSREPARTIWRSDTIKMPTDWTPDNKWIAVVERGERGDYDAWLLASDGSGRKQPLATTSFNEVNVRFSRDGQWVTYVSNESGRRAYRGAFSVDGAAPDGVDRRCRGSGMG